ncbi:hypothetical protein [Metallibacterium scheffleri]|nr:hypothetical protein [Metallibacterium scheffleri]
MTIKISAAIKSYRIVEKAAGTIKKGFAAVQSFVAAEDRRLTIPKVPEISGVLRWEKRPRPPGGNPSWTYMVDAPGGSFAVTIGHIENGHMSPFEVWAMGEAPRGLSALAQSISMDMRTLDREWLRRKLESLAKCPGEPFVITMPNGIETRVPSAVAAFARLVLYRCEELGAFSDEGSEHPLIDALMSAKEPKTTAEGTLSWTVDVTNHGTGDDFCLFLKEAMLPNAQRRPFSLWLSGNYPRSLDGLCKSLSLDMRIVDPGWILRKTDQLIDAAEPMGGFMAQVPGAERSAWYPSTVAYIAALIQYRFKVLGYCDEHGRPLGKTVLSVINNQAMKERSSQTMPKGKDCTECGAVGSVVASSGCEQCAVCAASRCG